MAVLLDHQIAAFDSGIRPTGAVHVKLSGGLIPVPVPHIEMTKTHHELHLIIEGPEGSDVTRCLQDATFAPLLPAIVTAYIAFGAGLSAAEDAALAPLRACLGNPITAQFVDQTAQVTWDV
jgi:hypothetical protein